MMTCLSEFRAVRPAFLAAIAALFVLCGNAGAASSAHFTGTNSYASTPDASTFDFPGSFTIDLWFQSAAAHTGTLVAKFRQASGTPTDDSYHIYVRDDDTLQARIQTTAQLVDLKAGGTIHDGQWHHAALVFDDTSTLAELYLDGVLKSSQTILGNLRDTAERVTLGSVFSGSGSPVPTSFFNGQIDELRFWNVARHGEQAWCLKNVTLLYNTPGLVSYYRFDEGSGASTADEVAPYEAFALYSGATFSTAEPPLRSRLSGGGQCRCGEVSGVFNGSAPDLTLVGDTITVLAGDSLVLLSHTMTVDSTVTVVRVLGGFRAAGVVNDSTWIRGQSGASSDGVIEILNAASTSLNYTRVSGFASSPLHFYGAAEITHLLYAANGGALTCDSNVTISDSRFAANSGLAIRVDSGNVTIQRSEFLANGGAICAGFGNMELDSVTFADNAAADRGGAVSVALSFDTRADIAHCTFTGNSASVGGAIAVIGALTAGGGDSLVIRDCDFTRNSADSGGAIQARSVNARMERCVFDSNTADIGGGISLQTDSARLCRLRGDSLEFTFNQGGEGSAVWLKGLAGAPVELRLTASTFTNNMRSDGPGASVSGSKIRAISGGPVIERCVFYDNQNMGGAAAAIDLTDAYDSTPVELRNLTVVLNTSDSAAVRVRIPAILRNCIVIENGGTREILGSNPTVAYCLTSDSEYHGAGGSFYADPLFMDFWGRDFHLTAGSPAINRGDPNAALNDPDGTRSDVGRFAADAFPPVWQSIADVPHDNGRQLMLQWLPSAGDDNRNGISSYLIYRVVNLSRLDENFELLATVPAAQLEGYGQIASTLTDSAAQGVPYYRYFIRAQSANPLAFWDTPFDSGYSVDNLAPGTPLLAAEQAVGGIALSWTAAPDSDVAWYYIYRDDALFDPDTVTEVFTSTTDTLLFDSVQSGAWYYTVRAVDRNGNLSVPSNMVMVNVDLMPPPAGLTIFPLGEWFVLRWQPVPGATNYNVFRSYDLYGSIELLGTVTDTYFLTPLQSSRGFFWVTAEQ
jgi:hypothetical protein